MFFDVFFARLRAVVAGVLPFRGRVPIDPDHRIVAMRAWMADAVPLADPSQAVSLAQASLRYTPGITIDVDETCWRRTPAGIEVRAWCLVPRSALGATPWPSPALGQVLPGLPERTRLVLALHLKYGMASREIASRFGIGRRQIRRDLLAGVRAVASQTEGRPHPED
jgi:hypothetical protein